MNLRAQQRRDSTRDTIAKGRGQSSTVKQPIASFDATRLRQMARANNARRFFLAFLMARCVASGLLRYARRELMFRRWANLLLSVLLVATLLWGGCVACPQFFQVPTAKKSCCDPAGHCKRTKTDPSQQKPCVFQQVEIQPKVNTPAPLVAVIHPILSSAIASMQLREVMRASEPLQGSPPKLPHERQALLSTFLI